MGVKAEYGEKMIEISLRFWTNSIAEKEGEIIPKQAWTGGMAHIRTNKAHGISASEGIHFNTLLEIGMVVEKLLIKNGIKLWSSREMQKYMLPET